MKPFHTKCPKCQARLQVAKETLIGRRVPCPKCKTPFLIEAPPGETAPSATTRNVDQSSNSANEERHSAPALIGDFDDIEILLQTGTGDSLASKSDRDEDDSLHIPKSPATESAPKVESDRAQHQVATGSAANSSSATQTMSTPPSASEWVSQEQKSRQRIIRFAVMAGALAIVLIIAVVFLVMNWLTGDSNVAENEAASNAASKTVQPEKSGKSDEKEKSSEGSNSEQTNPSTVDSKGKSNEGDVKSNPNETVEGNPTNPDSTPKGTTDSNSTTGSNPTNNSTGTPVGDPNGKSGLTSDDNAPKAFNLEDFTGEKKSEPTPKSVLEELNELGAMMRESPYEKAVLIAQKDILATQRMALRPTERTMDPPKEKIGEPSQALSASVLKFDFPESPLREFLDVWSNATTLPVALDSLATAERKVTLNSPVKFSGENVTLLDSLQQAAGEVGLVPRVEADHVVLTIAGYEKVEEREFDVPFVADSFGDKPEVVVGLVKTMCGVGKWPEGDGERSVVFEGNKLKVKQSADVQLEVQKLLRKWEEQIKIELKPEWKTGGNSSWAMTQPFLHRVVNLRVLEPVSLEQLATDLGTQSVGEIRVNWTALCAEGWNIRLATTLNVSNLPLHLALDDLLEPLGLTYRALGPDLIEITTVTDLLKKKEIEAYRVDALFASDMTLEDFASKLRGVFPPEAGSETDSRFFYDPKHKILIANLSQPQQRILARLLESWIEFTK